MKRLNKISSIAIVLLCSFILSLLFLSAAYGRKNSDDVKLSLDPSNTKAIYKFNGKSINPLPGSIGINRRGYIRVISGKAVIVCANGSVEFNKNNASDFIQISRETKCHQSSKKYLGKTSSYPKGGYESSKPYIVSPRVTIVENPRPTFRWNHVDAESYSIQLHGTNNGMDKKIWNDPVEILVKSNSSNIEDILGIKVFRLEYPLDRRALQEGWTYYLEVKAEGKKIADSAETIADPSQYDETFGIGTTRSDSGNGISHLQFTFKNSTVSSKQLSIGEADKLAESGYVSSAILKLEELQKVSPTPSGYRRLGELYAESGLSILAERSYEAALNALSTVEDPKRCEAEQMEIQKFSLLLNINAKDDITLKCPKAKNTK
jgi:hypothetical protein